MTLATTTILRQILREVFSPDARDTVEQFATTAGEPVQLIRDSILVGVLTPDPDGLLPVWPNYDALRTYRSARH